MSALVTIQAIDSHTAGEPTRVVIAGGPPLGGGPVARQLQVFRDQFDGWRSAIVNEPRGSDVLVGALLCPAEEATCASGVIFFNNVGFLGMCGHGALGVVKTLAHIGRLQPGTVRLETCVGVVSATLHPDGGVSLENVPSFRKHPKIPVPVMGLGIIHGDVAWGGNWFFLVDSADIPDCPSLTLKNSESLTDLAWRLRQAVNSQGFPEVDHIEIFGPPSAAPSRSRNFVLCPGKAYDRSPCGTGTSAKLACLAAEGKLAPGEPWVQEGILGSSFTGSYRWLGEDRNLIVPTLRGTAHITSRLDLLLDPEDPFQWGIRPH